MRVTAGMRRGARVLLLSMFLTTVAVLLGAGIALAATTTTVIAPSSAISPTDPREYVQGCFACHGREGTGSRPAIAVTSASATILTLR
jgi:cytochrome c553